MTRRSAVLWGALIALALAAPAAHARSDAATLERGRKLVEGIVACGNCHVQRGPQGQPLFDKGLSGGFVIIDAPEMRVVVPNITPDAATGIGRWTDAQLRKAIREGVRPDGSIIGPPMPIEDYRHMSDADVDAIVAYLRAQPAVSAAQPKSVYRIPLPPNYGPPLGKVSAPPMSNKRRYGEYLVRIGHCMECHSPRTPKGELVRAKLGAGGAVLEGPWGKSVARNLTPHASGLKGWTDAEIARAIRTGVRRDGTPLKPPMGFDFYKNIDDAEMAALIAYLRSLKPHPFGGG
ncbi:MAG TPA: c-type cytochrome [Burkholderiaceae bacterium]|nr:c-type cytochrome [Burkholderiaceae bacterium]